MAKRAILQLAAAVCLMAATTPSHAALLAYDGFETVSGAAGAGQYSTTPGSIIGQGPGLTGFDAGTNWTGSDHPVRPVTVQTGGLTYAGLSTLDGALYTARLTNNSGSNSSAKRDSNFGTSIPDQLTERWFSFLIQPNVVGYAGGPDDPFEAVVNFHGSLSFTIDDNGNLTIMEARGENDTIDVSDFVQGQTHLLVTKVLRPDGQPTGNDQENISVWLNPDVTAGEAGLGTPDVFLTGGVINGFKSSYEGTDFASLSIGMQMAKNDDFGQSVVFDEFRVGESAADIGIEAITAIPEPGSAALALLSVLGLSIRRRPGMA